MGNGEAGKSTLLGVLTQGELDNGRGKARLNLFRHLHEIQSGRTSSISHEILGFNLKGEVCKIDILLLLLLHYYPFAFPILCIWAFWPLNFFLINLNSIRIYNINNNDILNEFFYIIGIFE